MDTGTGVSISRLQGEMQTPLCSPHPMEAVTHCRRSDSEQWLRMALSVKVLEPNNRRNKGDWLTAQDPGEVRACSCSSDGRQCLQQVQTRQWEAVLVRGSLCSHTTQATQKQYPPPNPSYPVKKEPQSLNVPRVARRHLEAPRPKKRIGLVHLGLNSARMSLLASFLFCIQQSDKSTNQTWRELSRPKSLPRECSWMVGISAL